MNALEPRVRVVQRQCAPRTFPCPHCGKRGQRKATHTRPIRDIAYWEILIIELTVGEYGARCACCKTFRSQLPAPHVEVDTPGAPRPPVHRPAW